ncbi:unnamed protein product [Auanema sp. JU1783]|nr:unnamed protein product [Auanema sp. JU1783]
MLDPVSLGIALTCIAFIIAIIFFVSSRGDDFDKVYDENTRKLLAQNKEKGKAKVKVVKKKEKKTEKVHDTKKSDAVCTDNDIQKEEIIEEAQLVEEQIKVTETSQNEIVPTTPSAEVNSSDESDGKKKKKKAKKVEKTEKSENIGLSSVQEKKPKKKAITLSSLDSNKVLTRFASVEDVEPEYISFLATHFDDTTEKISFLTREVQESTRMFETQRDARLAIERKLKEQQKDLTVKLQMVEAMTIERQTTQKEIVNLRTTLQAMSASLKQSASIKDELESLKAEKNRESVHLSNLQNELKTAVAQTSALKSENESITASFESLKKEFVSLESVLKAQKLNSEKNIEAGRDQEKLLVSHQKEKEEWTSKQEKLLEEYRSLQLIVADLNQEVGKFEEHKKQVDLRESQLETKWVKKEQELIKKFEALQNENGKLADELNSQQEQNKRLQISHEENVAKLSVQVNTLQAKGQENGVKPGKTVSDDSSKINAENDSLRLKNQELRERNFKILENFRELENRVSGTAAVKQNVEEKKNDDVTDRFNKLVNAINKSLSLSKTAIKDDKSYTTWLDSVSAKIAERNTRPESEKDSKHCEAALNDLSNQLSLISSLATQQRKDYEDRIMLLENKLKRSTAV